MCQYVLSVGVSTNRNTTNTFGHSIQKPNCNFIYMNTENNTAASQYNQVDWKGVPKNMNSITIVYSKTSAIAAAVLYIMVGGLTLLLFVANGLKTPGIFIALANALLLALIVYLRARAKRKSAKSFTATGVLTGNGQEFLWSDFRGKVERTGTSRYGRDYTWRIELIFTENRQAWIIPIRVKNFTQVDTFLETLPTATAKE